MNKRTYEERIKKLGCKVPDKFATVELPVVEAYIKALETAYKCGFKDGVKNAK